MERNFKALLFSGMMILSSLFLVLTGPLAVPQNLTIFLVQIFGLILILWAMIAKRMSKQEHTHNLPQGYFFITKGPYEIIRHPIYAGFILIMMSLVQYNFTFLRVWAFLALSIAILLKILREEHTMEQLVTKYHEYQAKTKRIIPYVF